MHTVLILIAAAALAVAIGVGSLIPITIAVHALGLGWGAQQLLGLLIFPIMVVAFVILVRRWRVVERVWR